MKILFYCLLAILGSSPAYAQLTAEQTRAALGGFGANIDVVDSQTQFDLDNGPSTNDVLNDDFVLTVMDASNNLEPICHRRVVGWVGADQTVTIDSACAPTVVAGDDVVIMPNGVGDKLLTAADVGNETLELAGWIRCTVETATSATSIGCDLTNPSTGTVVTAQNDDFIGRRAVVITSSAVPPALGENATITDSAWDSGNAALDLTLSTKAASAPGLSAVPAVGDILMIIP
jgi:hypothetical protein